jgi:ABC-type multidrug transport system permease subunit
MRWIFVVQVVGIALIVSALWFQIEEEESRIQDLAGAIFFVGVFWQMFPLFSALSQFPAERAVLFKERAAGAYRLSAYFCSKTLSELPFDVMYVLLFITLCFWICSFYVNGAAYVEFFLAVLLACLASQSLGLLVSSAIMDFEKSIVFASIFMLFQMLAGGFYVAYDAIPIFIRWVSHISIVKYMYELLLFIVFPDDRSFACSSQPTKFRALNNGQCPIPGNVIRKAYDVDGDIGSRIGALIAFLVGYRVLAYVALRYKGKAR